MGDHGRLKLSKLMGEFHQLTYEAVKAGAVDALPRDDRLLGQAMQEHTHLSHVHNALEFADLREGAPYEVAFQGNTVNPLALGRNRIKSQTTLRSRDSETLSGFAIPQKDDATLRGQSLGV